VTGGAGLWGNKHSYLPLLFQTRDVTLKRQNVIIQGTIVT